MIPVTDARGNVTHAEGRVGSSDEQAYLTVMIDGVKHFFDVDAAVALTTTFTQLPPGATERRALAKSVSRSYAAFRPPSADVNVAATSNDGALWSWADDVEAEEADGS